MLRRTVTNCAAETKAKSRDEDLHSEDRTGGLKYEILDGLSGQSVFAKPPEKGTARDVYETDSGSTTTSRAPPSTGRPATTSTRAIRPPRVVRISFCIFMASRT